MVKPTIMKKEGVKMSEKKKAAAAASGGPPKELLERASAVGIGEASIIDWWNKYNAELINMVIDLLGELFSMRADPVLDRLNFGSVKSGGQVSKKSSGFGDCVDCFCCILAVIDEASLTLSTACCKCCSDEGCSEAERQAACQKARTLLTKAVLALSQCC